MESPITTTLLKRRSLGIMTALLAVLLITAGPAEASAAATDDPNEKTLLSWTAELAANSRYVWRGLAFSEGAVLQPSAGISYGGLTLSLWSSIDPDRRRARPGLNEADVFLTYSWERKGLTIEPGLSVYTYPRQGPASPATTEATLYVSVPLAGPLSAYLDQALDISAYAGGYFAEAGLSLETRIREGLSLEAAASQAFGSETFNRAYWEIPRGMLDVFSLRLALNWSLGRNLFLRPHLEDAVLTSSRLRRAAGRSGFFNLGLTLGVGLD